ncbi:MAG: PstS family phosphate ABC transporter substrate-binding protein [Fidelibacterota bacterium]
MMKNTIKLISVFLLSGLLFNGCSKGNKGNNYITIKGSDTMVHLASNWAEAYMKTHPAVNISVTGGGSGTGIAALLNGTTDICIASRKIKSKELELAKEKGLQPDEIITARDGIAVVVNPGNPITSLTIEQIGKIYTGAYTNWTQVSGPDKPIIVLSRESSSGTYVFFQKRVMNKKDYTRNAMLMPSTSAIVQSVAQDEWAIGYVGLGYALGAGAIVKMLAVKEAIDSQAIIPAVETVQSGAYAIARPLHFYTDGVATGTAKNFVDFVLSGEGQKIVLETGYVPVN